MFDARVQQVVKVFDILKDLLEDYERDVDT